MAKIAALVLVLALMAFQSAASAQPITSERLRGEWLGKIEGFTAANDAGERGFRFWTVLGTDGAGRARYIANGKSEPELIAIAAEDDTLKFTAKDRARVVVKLTAPDELTGTWTMLNGAPLRIKLKRQTVGKKFDRAYSGRGEAPGTGCESLEMKAVIAEGKLTGTIARSYASYTSQLDLVGEVWSSGDIDFSIYRAGVLSGYSTAKIEAGRLKTKLKYFTNCEPNEFDLR